MHIPTFLGGCRINIAFTLINILVLTSLVSCQPSKRSENAIVPKAVQDFDMNAAEVFPHGHDKRLLGALLSGVNTLVNTLLGVGAATTTTPAQQTTAPAAVPTTTAQGESNTPAPATTPTNAANSQGSSPTTTNQPANPAATSEAPVNTQANQATTTNIGKNGIAQSSGSGVVSGTTNMATVSHVITDHLGNTIAVTGTAPVTLTYLTTLPNGVVSTVTEIVTPTSVDSHTETSNAMSPGKIAAVVATLVTVFLITFAVALLLLMLRKKRRAIQLTRSRPNSASSFGSVSDEYAHDPRRNSRTALAPVTSVSSYKTAPAYVDGTKLDFPLPPVPAAAESSKAQRPISGISDSTYDYGFKEQQMSRASIIEERNFYRKIGNYPAAGTYTPFAVAPTSEMGHGDEPLFSPADLEAALERGKTAGKAEYEEKRLSRQSQFSEANPFSDPSPSMAQATARSVSNGKSNLLPNPGARQTGLWRKPTFGSSTGKHQTQPSIREEDNRMTSSYEEHTMRSTITSEYGTAHGSGSEAHSDHRYTSSSEDHHSYHSAFEHSSQISTIGPSGPADNENPFADTNASKSQPSPPSSFRPGTATSSGNSPFRPDTATSSGKASVVSSVINPQFGRDLSASPDPRDLFYRAPSTGQSQLSIERISEDSRRSSDGASTVRASFASQIAYPSLHQVMERDESASKTKQ